MGMYRYGRGPEIEEEESKYGFTQKLDIGQMIDISKDRFENTKERSKEKEGHENAA